MMYLESPYPTEGKVEVVNMTAQLVDSDGTPVPLSDVGPLLSRSLDRRCHLCIQEYMLQYFMQQCCSDWTCGASPAKMFLCVV